MGGKSKNPYEDEGGHDKGQVLASDRLEQGQSQPGQEKIDSMMTLPSMAKARL